MDNAEQETKSKNIWYSWPFLIGYILTLLFSFFWLIAGFQEPINAIECENRFCVFWNSPPNEMGDTFAGLFGSLAFVWIVVTVIIQGLELREQRKEIKAGREAQETQAQALLMQAGVLANQHIALQEQRHDSFVISLLESVRQTMSDLRGPLMTWEITQNDLEGKEVAKSLQPFERYVESGEARFLSVATDLIETWVIVETKSSWPPGIYQADSTQVLSRPVRSHLHRGLLEHLERIMAEEEHCSVQMKLEIQRLAVNQFKREYGKLMRSDSCWNGDFDPKDFFQPEKFENL